ncbi:hypothetical protein M569_06050, partial [Genlisea aurea]
PLHHHTRSSSNVMKKPQNAKAAAQRLAQVMAHQSGEDDDDDEDDDLLYDLNSAPSSTGVGLAGSRPAAANRSPMSVRKTARPIPNARAVNPVDQQPLSGRNRTQIESLSARTRKSGGSDSTAPSNELRSSSFAKLSAPLPQATDSDEEAVVPPPSSAHGRSPSFASSSSDQQPSSARFSSAGRPSLRIKTAAAAAMAPPIGFPSIKSVPSGTPSESQLDKSKKLSLDFGTFKFKDPPTTQQSSSALQDELDMLQEENDSLLEKLRLAEERCEEAESRARQLEKQIASLGEGVTLESRLLSRQTARDEATSALEQLGNAEKEVRSLRTTTRRMILSKVEMEEVVLKRSWLAMCWGLCVRLGILGEIAGTRNEYWSAYASHPVEIILAAGRKAKDENLWRNTDLDEREKALKSRDEISQKPNVESMLLVEKGLRELTSLKVEEAIALAMAQNRRPSVQRFDASDELKLPADGENLTEVFELSPEESEGVLLKQAWLTYFWRRAIIQDLEPDIVDERLQFWINQGTKPPTSLDAVNAERGLVELRKLGIETKLWEECRRQADHPDSGERTLREIEYEI